MKNWKYIEGAKVGNAFSHGDEVLVNSPDWKGMAVVLSQTGSKVRIYSSDGEVVVEEKYVRKVGNAGITDKEFNSESEMRRWCIEHNYTYTPVGGGYYRLEDDSGKNRKDLEAHVKAGNNKIGNETIASHPESLVAQEIYKTYLEAGKDENKALETLSTKYKSIPKEALKKHLKDAIKAYASIVRNSKTGNDTAMEYATRKPKVINEDKTGAEEFFKRLSEDVKEREEKDDADIEKVGNRVIEKESEMSQELKNLLKKAPEWIKEKIKYAFSHGFTIDEKDFITAIKKEVGNSKTGNSAQDDKFAYVMREFDEGKLKTPDGKIVTDPAQAKAIAYSESKKTENGLARARNAMNKRCGNSQVTLWKGNDSVLISEDGIVQYLESNSFETDRDKYGSMQEAIDDLTKKGYRKK